MKEEKGGNGRRRKKQEKILLLIASQNVPNGAEERFGHRSFGRVGPFSFPPDSHFLVSFYVAFFHRETNVGNRPTDRQKEEGGEKRRGCNETYHWEMVSGQKGQKRKYRKKEEIEVNFLISFPLFLPLSPLITLLLGASQLAGRREGILSLQKGREGGWWRNRKL